MRSVQTGSEWNSHFCSKLQSFPVVLWENKRKAKKNEEKLRKAKKNEEKLRKAKKSEEKKNEEKQKNTKKRGKFLKPHLHQPP